jgi:hypothetical protein
MNDERIKYLFIFFVVHLARELSLEKEKNNILYLKV